VEGWLGSLVYVTLDPEVVGGEFGSEASLVGLRVITVDVSVC